MTSLRAMFVTAGEDVRSQPLRTLVSIAGLVAAIIAVIVVNSASQLSVDANTEFIAREYGRPATVSVSGQVIHPLASQDPGRNEQERGAAPVWTGDSGPSQSVTHDAISMLEANGIPATSANFDVLLPLATDNGLTQVNGKVVSPGYIDIRVLDMEAGRFPVDTADGTVLHAVVNEQFIARQGWTLETTVGRTVDFTTAANTATEHPLQQAPLGTIIIDGVANWSGIGSDILIVSSIPRPELVESTGIQVLMHVNENDIGLVTDLVQRWSAEQDLEITDLQISRTDMLADLEPILSQQNVTATAVSAVALAIGGLGILGVGLANVRERSAEYGLRRALGASTMRIFFSGISQTLLEVLIAVAIAIPASALIVSVFARQLVLDTLPLPESTTLPLSSVAIGVGAALVVGILAGLFPAWRAARLSVVQALRGS